MEGEMKEKPLRIDDQSQQVGVDDDEVISLKEKIWRESKKMWVVAASAIFTRFSTFGINVISQAFIGHIGPTELAGFALVMTVIYNVCKWHTGNYVF